MLNKDYVEINKDLLSNLVYKNYTSNYTTHFELETYSIHQDVEYYKIKLERYILNTLCILQYTSFSLDAVNIDWWWCINLCRVPQAAGRCRCCTCWPTGSHHDIHIIHTYTNTQTNIYIYIYIYICICMYTCIYTIYEYMYVYIYMYICICV